MTVSTNKHYLVKVMKGFNNYYGTKVDFIENYGDAPNKLIVTMTVNPTYDKYTDVPKINAVVTYNLKSNKYTIKLEGSGSRQYGKQVKNIVEGLMDGFQKEANDYLTGDTSEAAYMTRQYYRELMLACNCTSLDTEMFGYKIRDEFESIKEIDKAFKQLTA